MISEEQSGESLRLRSRWVHGVRLLFVLAFLVTVTIGAWQSNSFLPEHTLFYSLCGSVSLLTIFALIWHHKVRLVRRFLEVQSVFDALVLLLLLYLTGGLKSLGLPMLEGHIVFSVFLLGRPFGRKLVLLTSTGVCLIGSLYLGAGDEGLPWVLPQWADRSSTALTPVVGQLLITCASLVAVCELSGALSELLRRARVISRDILAPLDQGVMVVGVEGEVLQINDAFHYLTGTDDSLLGQVLTRDMVPEEVLDMVMADRRDLKEFVLNVGDESIPVECQVLPMADTKGQPLGLVVTLTDMTEHEEVLRMRHQKQRSESVAHMASGIAHEVRNPLAAMRSALQSLGDDSDELSPEHRKLIDMVIREGDRLDNIVGSFLDFSKLKPRKVVRTDLAKLLRETYELLVHHPERGEVKIDVQAEGPLYASVDPEQMQAVFLNLGLNALQAMKGSGNLVLRGNMSPTHVQIVVEDDGPGVSEDDLEKVFDPFFTTRHEGTGMGLAWVDRIVREHGGMRRLKNRPEGGCRFEVAFPVAGDL